MRSNNRGQFVPLAAQVTFAGVMLIVATLNVYRVARAKLQAQNMADAVALAVAAMEAKEINVVVDRDEWLNHMYPVGTPKNEHQLPNISQVGQNMQNANKLPTSEYLAYAQIVATINQAQSMFIAAYERFIGVDQSQVPGQNAGPGSLQDILSEISGLQDPSVTVVVYNTDNGAQAAAQQARQIAQSQQSSSTGGANIVTPAPMAGVPFETIPVMVRTDDNPNGITLNKLMNLPDKPAVGWMRPVWDSGNMSVNTSSGKNITGAIGARAVVVKKVRLMIPLVRPMYVTARAAAYVVQGSGLSVKPDSTGQGIGGKPLPPDSFRPTYYVKLGSPS